MLHAHDCINCLVSCFCICIALYRLALPALYTFRACGALDDNPAQVENKNMCFLPKLLAYNL